MVIASHADILKASSCCPSPCSSGRIAWQAKKKVCVRGKITVNPLLSSSGAYLCQEKTYGISSPLRTRIQSGKAQVQEGWRSCGWGSESNLKLVNKPSRISAHEVLQLWMNRELKIQRRGRKRERQKNNWFN